MLRVVLTLYFLCFSALVEARQCPVHFKPVGRVQRQRDRADCESITSADPLHALQWLTTATSNSVRNGSVAGVVDTDGKNSSCQVWSIRKQKTLRKCGPFDFSFETYWVKAGCAVTLTFTARSSSCSRLVSREVSALGVLFSSASVLKAPQNAQFLRIHDNGLGSVPATLTEMYGKQEDSGSALRDIPLVSLDLALHPAALQDEGAGHSSARAWQLWAARELVRAEGLAVCRVRRAGRGEGRQAPAPTQHSDVLKLFQLDPSTSRYDILLCSAVPTRQIDHVILDVLLGDRMSNVRKKESPSRISARSTATSAEDPRAIITAELLFSPREAPLPTYCSVPAEGHVSLMTEMTRWIRAKLKWKCHPRVTSSQCYQLQYVDPFIPCLPALQAALAEDYAWARGWCSAAHSSASVPELPGVEVSAAGLRALKRFTSRERGGKGLRLGFLLTVYRDARAVMRLLRRLHSPRHLYVLAVDAASPALAAELRLLVLQLGHNVFISSATPVVYMASSASQVLAQGLSWFLRHAGDVDYLVSCTGSDYPLLPLAVMEAILQARSPPCPSVMRWGAATWQDALAWQGLSEERALARDAVLQERRPPLAPMESRATKQFGVPLTCHGQKSYVRLQARARMEDNEIDTQWLFGKCNRKGQVGNANAYDDPKHSSLPRDGVFRVWAKSDPATTAVFDRRSAEYIVHSDEGRKYYHFFKHMLLGSEEHYFVSLLANWQKTAACVSRFSSMAVWNSWTRGSLQPGGRVMRGGAAAGSPHTSYLTRAELSLLRGLARNGVFFARKFSGNNASSALLDELDAGAAALLQLLNHSSSSESLSAAAVVELLSPPRRAPPVKRRKDKVASHFRAVGDRGRSPVH